MRNIYDDISLLLACIFGSICYIVTFYHKKIYSIQSMAVVIIVGSLLGIGLSEWEQSKIIQKETKVLKHAESKNTLLQVIGLYKKKEFQKQYLVKIKDENIRGIINIPFNFSLQQGDIIKINQKIEMIENKNDTFLYKQFMQSKNIFFLSYVPYYEKIGYIPPHTLIYSLQSLREKSLKIIHHLFPEEEAIFLGGILIGARESLPKELSTHFNHSGLTHFIAVSGFNITILIVFLSVFTAYFPLWIRGGVVLVSIVGFILFVGPTAPVIRAGIMGGIGFLCLLWGQSNNSISAILLTGICMILWSPLSLNYDVSLHLSFGAVIGIVAFQDFFKKVFYFVPTTFALREALVLTFSALVPTLPLMLFHFGQVSILAPISNILVTWTIPLAMLGGFIALLLFPFFEMGAWIVGGVTYLLLRFDITVVHLIGGWEYAVGYVELGMYRNIFLLYYFGLMLLILLKRQKKESKNISLL
ncbi:ComEC/Rec2 family competence protein [Candidatus Gracilibacteria bacterium]|nr:ComEC/Rec2 family competence protein [Candidatus Gracilibacteria bacterium]